MEILASDWLLHTASQRASSKLTLCQYFHWKCGEDFDELFMGEQLQPQSSFLWSKFNNYFIRYQHVK